MSYYRMPMSSTVVEMRTQVGQIGIITHSSYFFFMRRPFFVDVEDDILVYLNGKARHGDTSGQGGNSLVSILIIGTLGLLCC